MGGCRCSYKNCTNTTKTRENLHFFHYPVKQKDRCRKWIENANKAQFFNLDEDQLRNKVVCETHFEECYFPNVQRKRLLQGAVPTLDGDSTIATAIHTTPQPRKLSDVQVLPANADGTIFVLEANHLQNNFYSEKIESYIYTNSGLVLPIKKCDVDDNDGDNNENHYKEETDEIEESQPPPPPKKQKIVQEATPSEDLEPVFEQVNYVFSNKISGPHFESRAIDPIATASTNHQREEEEEEEEAEEEKVTCNKYLMKRIQQNSKDIALLKQMLKSKCRVNNGYRVGALTALRRHIPQSLFEVVRLNVRENTELSSNSLDFFSDIYNTSPSLYKLFIEKYKWKLPSPQMVLRSTKNKSNGHICKSGDLEIETVVLPD